jgi:hypothetical protein
MNTGKGGAMTTENAIEFQVDEEYENEKGVFTVVSMHRNTMVIRWKDGEEIRTDIELQKNIQTRRQWEEMNRRAKTNAAKKGTAEKRAGFNGFLPEYFKKTAAGTNWRGRTQLGGGVAAKLPAETFSFNSWAFSQKPELHWMDQKHHQTYGNGNAARLFVRLNPEELIYGLCVPRYRDEAETSPQWKTFIEWVTAGEGEHFLHTLAEENKLLVYDRSRPVLGRLTPSADGWRLENTDKGKTLDGVAELLAPPPPTGVTLLEIARRIKKAEAIDRGLDIVEDIGTLFTRMIPMYNAAVTDL